MAGAQDTDLMDIDIEMDLDDHGAGLDEEFQLEEGEEPSFVPSTLQNNNNTTNLIPAIYTEDPALEPVWEKIHIRGVDDFHTNDILAFVNDYSPDIEAHVQWIDDTSANIVFKDKQLARSAILSLISQTVTSETIAENPFDLRTAKPLTSRPASMLMVRVAQAGDRKRKNARDASRYYLLHPDEDPTERMRKEFANGRTQRGGDAGEYRRRRFDDREHRRRKDKDHNGEAGEDFAASMYDDAPAAATGDSETTGAGARGRDLFSRITKSRRRSASPGDLRNGDAIDISDSDDNDDRARRRRNGGYRDRSDRPPAYSRNDPNPIPRTNMGKELFGDSDTTMLTSSTTNNRSSSAVNRKEGTFHSDKLDLFPSPHLQPSQQQQPSRPASAAAAIDTRANAAAAKRLKADLLSAAQTSPRSHHRRSHAMDAKNAEDLAERFARKSISIDSTKSGMLNNAGVELFPSSSSSAVVAAGGGMNIRGSAATTGNGGGAGGGMSIKGRAEVKELFPDRYIRGAAAGGGGGGGGKTNQGKELFDEPVREKRVRRRAGDLFD